MASTAARRLTRCSTSLCSEEEGQASIEAALLLPAMLAMVILLVQPICLLYTHTVMQQAAAEAVRLMATRPDSTQLDFSYRAYVLRRLAAVPDVPIFHVGSSQGWDIQLEGSSSSHRASAGIATSVALIPPANLLAAALGEVDAAGNLVLRVEVSAQTRPDWLEGGYGDWSQGW